MRALHVPGADGSRWETLREIETHLQEAVFATPLPHRNPTHENEAFGNVNSALDQFEARFPFTSEVNAWLEQPAELSYLGVPRSIRGYMKMHPDNLFRILHGTFKDTDIERLRRDFPLVVEHCLTVRERMDAPSAADVPGEQRLEYE